MSKKQQRLTAVNRAPGYDNPDCHSWSLASDVLCDSQAGYIDSMFIEEDDTDFDWNNF